jgi:diguanylate cyclase (GGDEF)-like protein
LSVLLIDVDHFKAFNDRHGHPAGDQCLTLLAQALARTVGPVQGLLARWGGEEFVAVLPHTTVRQAAVVAEGLREAVEALNLRHEAAPLRRVTISVGVATWVADGEPDTLERVLAMADGALYQAKSAGRNCCRMAPGHIEAD